MGITLKRLLRLRGINMYCLRCHGFMAHEIVHAEGHWITQCRCINCGDIQCIREPMQTIPQRKTGRGKDSRRRQKYGTSKQILQLSPEEWDICRNQDLAKRFDCSETWVSQCRRVAGKARRYKSRGLVRQPQIWQSRSLTF